MGLNRRLAVILGIRPDVIRASIILQRLRSEPDCELTFIWSGQHYSDNLKDVFFRELGVDPPDVELGAVGITDSELSSSVIVKLASVLTELRPAAAVFLGDTNTVIGALAAAQLNIPIVHIEGCMRSYDWRMPEEKYRTIVDHLSDVIYAYLDEYKRQGVLEGINPDNIVVTGNPIVDVLNKYGKRNVPSDAFFSHRGLARNSYYLATCHRRENVEDPGSLKRVMELFGESPRPIYFLAGYRTQACIKKYGLKVPSQVSLNDPIGYEEMLGLMTSSCGVLTDSGTVVEEACVLGVPSLQMRRATERPQVYDVGASVKFDPSVASRGRLQSCYYALERLRENQWVQPFGDGRASERIVNDLLSRLRGGGFARHRPENYHHDVSRSYRDERS